MMAIGTDRLVILERTEQTTKLHEVELSRRDQHPRHPWDDVATKPSLEQTDVAAA